MVKVYKKQTAVYGDILFEDQCTEFNISVTGKFSSTFRKTSACHSEKLLHS